MDIRQVLVQHANTINYDDLCGGRMCGFYVRCAMELSEILPEFAAKGFEFEIDATSGGLSIKLMKGEEVYWKFSQYYDTFSEFLRIERTIDFKMYQKAHSKLFDLRDFGFVTR